MPQFRGERVLYGFKNTKSIHLLRRYMIYIHQENICMWCPHKKVVLDRGWLQFSIIKLIKLYRNTIEGWWVHLSYVLKCLWIINECVRFPLVHCSESNLAQAKSNCFAYIINYLEYWIVFEMSSNFFIWYISIVLFLCIFFSLVIEYEIYF